jgi:purine catabolism regulator
MRGELPEAAACSGVPVLTVKEALGLDVLRGVKVVAGDGGLDRCIRWCHIIDNPEIVRWIQGGELLLTTGYGWPQAEPISRRTIRALSGKRLAAILFDPGPFLGAIPANVVEEGARLQLPVLLAPRTLRFADVTEAIGRELIRRQYDMIERADRYHRQITAAAVDARDLNDIALTVCRLTRRSVTIEDAEFRVLAHAAARDAAGDGGASILSGAGPALSDAGFAAAPGPLARANDAPPAAERSAPGSPFPHPEGDADARGFRARVRMAEGALRLNGRAACAIRAGTELLGYLWILEGASPLGDLELRVAEHGSMVAALHMLRQRAQATVETRIGHTVVDALVRGDVPEQDLLERARLLGFDPHGAYAVMMVSLLDPAGRSRKWPLTNREEYYRREHAAQLVRRLLAQERLPILSSYSLNRILWLLPVPAGARHAGRLRRLASEIYAHLAGAAGVPPVMVAVSAGHAGLAGVATGYWEADRASDMARDADRVIFFGDLTLAHLLAQIPDTTSLAAVYAGTLGPVLGGPQGKVLRDTLWALVDAGFNKESAAAAVGIHRNTMRTRLERIESLLGRPLADPAVRRDLAVMKEIEHLLVLDRHSTT